MLCSSISAPPSISEFLALAVCPSVQRPLYFCILVIRTAFSERSEVAPAVHYAYPFHPSAFLSVTSLSTPVCASIRSLLSFVLRPANGVMMFARVD